MLTMFLLGLLYMLPTLISLIREGRNLFLVAPINIFLGVTMFGWLIAFVLAIQPWRSGYGVR